MSNNNLSLTFLLGLFILVFSEGVQAQSNYLTGGELTYKYIGGSTHPYLYKIQLSLYREYTSGIGPLDSTQLIHISSSCYGDTVLTLKRLIPPAAQASPDQGFLLPRVFQCVDPSDSNLIQISEHRYEDTITLPGRCADFRFSFNGCCRDTGLSNYQAPPSDTLYLDAILNHSGNSFIPNSSITFDSSPLVNICINSSSHVSFGVTDPNGDSLYYEIIRPALGANSYLNWAIGYSKYNPIQNVNGFSFSQRYGTMQFTPAIIERSSVRVKVHEYHYGSIFPMFFLIGSTTREMVLNVVQKCDHTPPPPLFQADQNNRDTSALFDCGNSLIKLKLSEEVLVESLAKDGSNFRITDLKTNLPVPILEAEAHNVYYGGLLTKEVSLKTFTPLLSNDSLLLYVKPGTGGIYLTNPCNKEFKTDSVILTSRCKVYVSVDEQTVSAIEVYPNPVVDFAQLTLSQTDQSVKEVILTDVSGRVVMKVLIDKNSRQNPVLDCSNLGSGLYLAHILINDTHYRTIHLIKN